MQHLLAADPGLTTISSFFDTLLTDALIVAGAVAALFIAVGGFLLITAGHNPDRHQTGLQAITRAVGGFGVVAFAKVFIGIVTTALAAAGMAVPK